MNRANLTEKEIVSFYNENLEKIYKFFYFKTLSKEVAEDLTQDTFISFVKIVKDQNNIENLVAFLYGIAKNIFLRYLKDKYKSGIPFSEFERDFENYAEEYVENIKNKKTLEERASEFIKYLPPKQKIVVQLRFIEKLSLKEIADKLNKDMNYVKTTQKRGIANLRRYVELGDLS
jgi:RNA polymerase sigma-70 factor (ECF subfamily)